MGSAFEGAEVRVSLCADIVGVNGFLECAGRAKRRRRFGLCLTRFREKDYPKRRRRFALRAHSKKPLTPTVSAHKLTRTSAPSKALPINFHPPERTDYGKNCDYS